MERQKVVIEGAGAVGVAALMHHKIKFSNVCQTSYVYKHNKSVTQMLLVVLVIILYTHVYGKYAKK